MKDKPENLLSQMTLRDYFAGQAPHPIPEWFMQMKYENGCKLLEENAFLAWPFYWADAMLKARSQSDE